MAKTKVISFPEFSRRIMSPPQRDNTVLPRQMRSGSFKGTSEMLMGDETLKIDTANRRITVNDTVRDRVILGWDGSGYGIKIIDSSGSTIFNISGTVDGSGIVDGTITTAKIANANITTAKIANLAVTNAKINDLSVSKLTAGTITSKAITLAVSAGTGDAKIQAGKTDFDNTVSGFILGIDDSDSDRAKFYIGDSSTYMNWTGTALNVQGADIVAGTIKTATSGQRVEINVTANSIEFIDASNNGALIYSSSSVLNFEGLDAKFHGSVVIDVDLDVTGTKNFNIPHPTKKDKRLVYSSVESSEVLLMCRGICNSEKEIKYPQHFIDITEPNSIQCQIGKLKGSNKISWIATGVRKGYKDYKCEVDDV